MDPTLVIAGIDAAVKLITLFANGSGAAAKVSEITAARIADGGRDWTDAERQAITDEVAKQKQYAIDQLAKPDAP
jgi:hypothetical protein